MAEALTKVSNVPTGCKAARFTLRDDNQQHYHRRVEMSNTPLYIGLNWRARTGSPVHHIGVFRLDLRALLRQRYIREEKKGHAKEVRVRFYRSDDGFIYLQSRQDSPALRVERAPVPNFVHRVFQGRLPSEANE